MRKILILLIGLFSIITSQDAMAQRAGYKSFNLHTTLDNYDNLGYVFSYENYYNNWSSMRIGFSVVDYKDDEITEKTNYYLLGLDYLPAITRGKNTYLKLPIGVRVGQFNKKDLVAGGVVGLEGGIVFRSLALFVILNNEILYNVPNTWKLQAGIGIKILL